MVKKVVYTFLLQLLCLAVFAQPSIQKYWALNKDLTFNVNGHNWQLNYSGNTTPSITNSVLTLTTNNNNSAASAFYIYRVNVTSNFIAHFTYTPSGSISADGVAFILQTTGSTALGAQGGDLGLSGISPCVDVMFNLYSPYGIGMTASTNAAGIFGTYTSVSPVVLNSGNPIDVTIRYSAGTTTLYVSLSEENTTHTYTYPAYTINIATFLGSNTAYVGFSGATGGSTSTQTISKFVFK